MESQFFLVSVSNLGLAVSQRLEFTILYPSKKLLPILPRSLVMMTMMIKINYNANNNDDDDYDDHVNNDDDDNSEDDDDDNSHVNNIIEALLFY